MIPTETTLDDSGSEGEKYCQCGKQKNKNMIFYSSMHLILILQHYSCFSILI